MKLYGKNPVIERIKSNPQSIRTIYLTAHQPDTGYVKKKAKKRGIPVVVVSRQKLLKMTGRGNAQGIAAEVDGFSYSDYDELLARAVKKKGCLIFLDGLTDPQNLGAIVRSAACLGHGALVLPTHDSVKVTEAVLRVASGADNFIAVAQVKNLSRAIRQAIDAGLTIYGSVLKSGKDLDDVHFSFPLGMVIGSEQKGIRPGIMNLLDQKVTIPMAHARMSLNAAQAATVLCYEIKKQRTQKA